MVRQKNVIWVLLKLASYSRGRWEGGKGKKQYCLTVLEVGASK